MATQGFGCMGLSAFYSTAKTTTPDMAKTIIHHAVNNGVTLFNTATFYGPLNDEGYGANLRLIKTAIQGLDRSKIQLMVKIGMDTRCPVEKTGTSWVLRVSAEEIEADVDYALRELGTDYLDVIVLCRVPKPSEMPIEECMRGLQAMVTAGKARHVGLSEASASTIRRAHAVYPLHCIEQEWSLWARDIEADIVPACRELGIKIVAYSPLGKGFLTGSIRDRDAEVLQGGDFRTMLPKFSEQNFAVNLKLVDEVRAIAEAKGCTLGQLSLAWLHSHSHSPCRSGTDADTDTETELGKRGLEVIPIPGTTNPAHFDENIAALHITLSTDELAQIERVFEVDASPGDRYQGNHNTFHEN